MASKHQSGPPQKLIRYEVRRERRYDKPPQVDEHLGLDRARVVALGYALDGPSEAPDFFTGRVEVVKVIRCQSASGFASTSALMDRLDEAGASVFLNSVELPRAR